MTQSYTSQWEAFTVKKWEASDLRKRVCIGSKIVQAGALFPENGHALGGSSGSLLAQHHTLRKGPGATAGALPAGRAAEFCARPTATSPGATMASVPVETT